MATLGNSAGDKNPLSWPHWHRDDKTSPDLVRRSLSDWARIRVPGAMKPPFCSADFLMACPSLLPFVRHVLGDCLTVRLLPFSAGFYFGFS